jgi:2-(1,2-epoxy-1,2-dihydrophenyl)acetyl-CoA isomerase
MGTYGDVEVKISDGHVATVEVQRPPNNYFDTDLIASLADALENLDADPACRAAVLCSDGKHFCAGAAFNSDDDAPSGGNSVASDLYDQAVRLFATQTPVVAAIQGAAIGGGLGVAAFADFRFAAPEARFSANFARLGFHQGFGLTITLPAIVGQQHALDMLYTGRRVKGEQAAAMGLVDRLVGLDEVRPRAVAFAQELAESAPLAVASIRQTMRGHLADAIRDVTAHELAEQHRLQQTNDFAEGIRATAERRMPNFTGD